MQRPAVTRSVARAGVLFALLGTVWVLTPHTVPLYDGIGFPDEPYRWVPARGGTAAATSAQVSLKVAGGVNAIGLIAQSAELGPQVSVYAPPHAFAVAGTAPVIVAARPVPPTAPLPPGKVDSDVYTLSFTSTGGPVTLVSAAQPPTVTMRAVSTAPSAPVFQYRAAGGTWRELRTRQLGRDVFSTNVAGAGDYVLVQSDAGSGSSSGGGHGALYAVLAAVVIVIAGALVGVRVASNRTGGGQG